MPVGQRCISVRHGKVGMAYHLLYIFEVRTGNLEDPPATRCSKEIQVTSRIKNLDIIEQVV